MFGFWRINKRPQFRAIWLQSLNLITSNNFNVVVLQSLLDFVESRFKILALLKDENVGSPAAWVVSL
jgi:hypothetical protein